ncbi:MAG: SDR family oxidoreductase [Gemmatimonadota bacterium]|jgi:NAD(P)-dependent dehydrogenase (short-subunit alcohol dehydrogenase family)
MTDFAGRTALVTGGTRGIGRAIVRDLLQAGFNVAFTARTESDVVATDHGLSDLGGNRVLGLVADVRDPDSCTSVVEAVAERFGGLDLLVNNAGIGIFASIQEMSVEDWHAQIDTNLSGVFYLSKAAIPLLNESEDAWILNIGSLAGRNTFAGGTAYNASKFGLLGMTEAMMLDLRYEGIRVSLIMPGSVDTSFGRRPAGEKEGWALTSEDVSRAVLDLLRYPGNALPSRIELRPSRPPRKS